MAVRNISGYPSRQALLYPIILNTISLCSDPMGVETGKQSDQIFSRERRQKMLFMTIYTWEPGQRNEIVKRRLQKGRLIPEGVKVLGEWTDLGGGRGFLLVEANDPKAIMLGSRAWLDLMKMEAVPIIDTEESMKLARRETKG
jgi:hypothetical protein